jgi:lipopolysaccharide/colanic/teichoic acid biosynthesis glycosyltransferase
VSVNEVAKAAGRGAGIRSQAKDEVHKSMSFLNYPIEEDAGLSRPSAGSLLPRPLQGASRIYRRRLKRVLDLALVILSLPVVLPVVALLAALVALDGCNPFYTQKRLGRGGRIFRIWKLRTMVPDADAHLARHLASDPEARREWTVKQKLTHDPRITPMGRLLRKTSLDELPQLWNVLLGDMSLVGPRPMMVDQKPLYPGRAYFALRPGLTGPWQVSDRNACSFADRAAYDAAYHRAVSLREDVRLLVATVRVVLRGTGC